MIMMTFEWKKVGEGEDIVKENSIGFGSGLDDERQEK